MAAITILYPQYLRRSVRLVGASVAAGAEGAYRPSATTICAAIIADAGRGAICGLTLRLPPEAMQPVAGDGAPAAADDGDGASTRCLHVSGSAAWVLEDSVVYGGVRVGAQAELAVVQCVISGEQSSVAARGTGVLVQGRARALVRASRITSHGRSGLTVQHHAKLWLQQCEISHNRLAVCHGGRKPCSCPLPISDIGLLLALSFPSHSLLVPVRGSREGPEWHRRTGHQAHEQYAVGALAVQVCAQPPHGLGATGACGGTRACLPHRKQLAWCGMPAAVLAAAGWQRVGGEWGVWTRLP